MPRQLVTAIAFAAIVATLAVSVAAAGDGPLPSEWRAVRAAAAPYHSLVQASRDGYVASSPCISAPPGVMGIHYDNAALLADGQLDPLRPEILLYVPKADGNLRLVAVEYVMPDADQDLATDGDRPSIFGQPFGGPMPGHIPGMPIHYDLHVWVAEQNPGGLFAPFNPAIRC